jgi:hypothetical protein
MAAIEISSNSRVTKDEKSGAIRSWFDTSISPQTDKAFVPRTVARTVLEQSAGLFSWAAGLTDLKDGALTQGPDAYSVRFTQEFKGIPVDASEVVVNMYRDSRVHSIYNEYHYDIPQELDPKKIKVDKSRARQIAERLAEHYENREVSEPVLIVYQYSRVENHPPKGRVIIPQREKLLAAVSTHLAENVAAAFVPREGQYFLAWDVRIRTNNPLSSWRVLIDAMTGRLITVIDLAQYATGNAEVFDPNPIVSSGDTTLRHTSAVATINAQRAAVTINRLDAPVAGNLRLHGSFVQMGELESPAVAEPVDPAGNFSFSFDDNSFLDAMAYFHLDRFQNYVQTNLAMNNAANYSIKVDPQGLSGQDNSHYVPGGSGTGSIAYGGGIVPVPASNPVPDAADAMVVLHEYGHAIQDNVNPGFNNGVEGTGEGFGDFLAAVFYDDKHANPTATRGFMMSWDSEMGTGSWGGRRYDVNWLYGDANYNAAAATGDPHTTGQFWCSTTFELYRKLGGDSQYSSVKSAGRDLTIRLHLMANFNVPAAGATFSQMALQIEAADGNLGGWRYPNGLHKKVIYDTFRRRQVTSFPVLPVDVYINDGRNGGYGSLTGNDLFTEKQFLDNYWSTQDLWVRVVQYANDADQQAGDPGDHVEPPVNNTAYLYIRVKNKGASDSGPITVKAYHSDPTIGLVWPTDWTPTDTPSIAFANIPAGGKHVFGPFPWTPTHVGHECVFAIAECTNDHAVTQDLAPMTTVAHSDLVPFDNNIAQRNLYPTAAKGKMIRGFWVSNPNFERSLVKLHFESTLPNGWTYHTNLATTEGIDLAPRDRRWVEVTIDQGTGPEITDFANPPAITISGSIGGKLIGGMSFYAAPPSAFPAPHKEPPCEVIKPSDLFCLNIPWKDCEIEGDLDIKLRFRCCKDKK